MSLVSLFTFPFLEPKYLWNKAAHDIDLFFKEAIVIL